MYAEETRRNTGSPSGDRGRDQLATRERQAGPCGVAERSVVPMKPGNSGGGKGPQLRTNARSDEGQGIGDEPNNSNQCSEVADGVARKSEGIAQPSFPCAVRQGVSEGCTGLCLRPLPSQRRGGGSGQPDLREHRRVRQGTVVGGTGARAEESNLSTATRSAGVYPQAGWEAETVRHTDGGFIMHLLQSHSRCRRNSA